MATVFTTTLGTYALTSEVRTIAATTDKDKVDVVVSGKYSVGDSPVQFYKTTLYAYNGKVELGDVGSLIEEYFRQHNRVAGGIEFRFDDVPLFGTFLYCENAVQKEFDPVNSLLLAAPAQRVHPDSTISFALLSDQNNIPLTVKVVGHLADGEIYISTANYSRPVSNYTATLDVASIIQKAMKTSADSPSKPLADVAYISVEYNAFQKLFFVVPAPQYLTFTFRNIYNVVEYIDIVGVMTAKTEISRETAICNGMATQYDRSVSRSFQVETEAIPVEEIPMFEQFLASHEVVLEYDGARYPVIISEETCEPSDDDGSLPTFKFTWRFADSRPYIFAPLMSGIMPSRRNVFDEKYSPEYD